MQRRGHSNTNERGSSKDRRARKLFLLATFGDGTTAPCADCGDSVDIDTIFVDRIVTRIDGGTYARTNIQPHCQTCSCRQGASMTHALRKAATC